MTLPRLSASPHMRPRARARVTDRRWGWTALTLIGLALIVLVLTPSDAWAGEVDEFEKSRSQGWLWAYLATFGAGVMTSLTPCVYPMIPIVVGIFGGRGKDVSRGRAILLATLYVVGMGLTFALLGTLFALIGGSAGALLANPAVIIPIVILYLVLATSMFGAFELQLPSALQQKLSGVSGDGVGGAFAMGLVGGFTAAPCTGPFLIGILGFVTKTGSVAVGSTLLFTYAIGIGVLFWGLAAFTIAMPKSGAWMEWMKSIGGVALVAAAIHFLRPLVPWLDEAVHPSWFFMVGAVLAVLAGLSLGAIHLSFHDRVAIQARKALAVAVTVVALTASISWILHVDRHLPWVKGDEGAAFIQARREGKGVMIDFWATWCTPCKELELTFAKSPVYETIVDNFVPLKFDLTHQTDADDAILKKYGAGTPTVLFLHADGTVLADVRDPLGPAAFMKVLAPAAEQIKLRRQTARTP